MTLKAFEERLRSSGIPAYHYDAYKQQPPYIVWAEYDAGGYMASNERRVRTRAVQVDFYTKKEYDPALGVIERLLTHPDIAFDGPMTDFDAQSRVIRHIYECEVIDNGSN